MSETLSFFFSNFLWFSSKIVESFHFLFLIIKLALSLFCLFFFRCRRWIHFFSYGFLRHYATTHCQVHSFVLICCAEKNVIWKSFRYSVRLTKRNMNCYYHFRIIITFHRFYFIFKKRTNINLYHLFFFCFNFLNEKSIIWKKK
jgi:hypothetical protein